MKRTIWIWLTLAALTGCLDPTQEPVDCESLTFDECERNTSCILLMAQTTEGDCLSGAPLVCMPNDRNCLTLTIATESSDGTCWLTSAGCLPTGWPSDPESDTPSCTYLFDLPRCE
jgi:hypothetical protein